MADSRKHQKDSQPSQSREFVDPARARPAGTDEQRQIELERAFAGWLDSPNAKLCLDALKSWYIHSIFGADASNEQLRYREGQRSVIGVIETYAERGRGHGKSGSGGRR